MYLVLITWLNGDTHQESFDSKRKAFSYIEANVDLVESIEIKKAW